MSKLRKFLALESTKRSLVIKAALLLFLVRVGLLLLPFRLARTLLLKGEISRPGGLEMTNSHVISTPKGLPALTNSHVISSPEGLPALTNSHVISSPEGLPAQTNSHVISTPDQVGGRDLVLSPSRIGWAVAAAGRVIPGGRSCLPQALTAEILLKSHGFPARLQIGVNRDGKEKFQAHAWVESGDTVVVGGSALASYTPLVAFEGGMG